MFTNIAKFFIENGKLTLVLVIATFIVGISSYLTLAKQYNPQIIVPTFEISVKTPGLTPDEVNRYVVSPMENKIMELEGIDEVYGISGDNYAYIMAKFDVGIDKEEAKIRITQKLQENLGLKPIGISDPIIKTIDPDLLPQITFSISNTNRNLNEEENYIYLHQIANIIKEKIKLLDNITTINIVGGFTKDIIIEVDTKKLEARNITIPYLYNILKNNNLSSSIGNINLDSQKVLINIDGKNSTIEKIKKTIIYENILLEDLANVKYGINRINKTSRINGNDAVFLGFGKKIGTNSVVISKSIIEEIEKIKKELPKNIEIQIIQNEGETAQNATNMLLINLLQSILIVVIVLSLALGFKNALNTAISIPLTLFSVFTIALIVGENINRITLFALILVLGMLVDDSTVVVENINRHLKERFKNGKTKLEAIMSAIKEVQLGVVLSTITRLLAFGSMFFVTDMMGEYMGPIPKFALMASVISTIVALSVNPWLSFYLNNDKPQKNIASTKGKKKKFKRPSIRKFYLNFMEKFLGESKKKKKKRKIFKILFWTTLIFVILAPIYGGIFKARMLPKSNQNQIYIWIDAPRSWTTTKMKQVEDDLYTFLKKDKTIKSISTTTGQAFMDDFANLFRGGSTRNSENQLSSRINLYSPEKYNNLYNESRESSEKFTIKLRPELKDYLLKKYPDIKVRLLEDPPGPPVKSTFMAKIKGSTNEKDLMLFTQKVEQAIRKVGLDENMVDIYNNIPTNYKKFNLVIDHDALSKSGLNTKEVIDTLKIIISGIDINILEDNESLEPTNIILKAQNKDLGNTNILNTISFTNTEGKKIPLSTITKKEFDFVGGEIETDKREKTISISAEIGDNSLIYPQIKLIKTIMSDEFLGNNYFIDSWSLYEINLIGISDGRSYKIEWGGEWEITLDTFRDLGIAMIIALLGIYLLLVGQFRNFRVAGIIMLAFLLGFFGIFPGFSILYLISGEYFSATSMIGIIALAGIVVGNSIILIEYINIMKNNGLTIKDALLKAGYTRFKPIILTSLTTVLGATTIIGDPVWSGLAWAIIWGLLLSSILTLIVIPIFYYDSQKNNWE